MGQARALTGRVDARHPQTAAARRQDARQHLDRRRLPGAVRADVPDHLAARHGEGDRVDRAHLAPLPFQEAGLLAHVEDLLDAIQFDEGIHRHVHH
ncbi:hypothetical protein M2156_005186 [Streptomyces sp. SAI-149]|nr:hypothetical protein [Streptomyces sp. SAI-149]